MYHNNVTNLIHFTFTITLLCLNPLHVSGVKRPSSEGSFWCELRAVVAVGWLQVVVSGTTYQTFDMFNLICIKILLVYYSFQLGYKESEVIQ
jgi:hypothetical protein